MRAFVKGCCVFLAWLAASAALGYGKARYDIQHCIGTFDTHKCHSNRAKEQH
ncbi:hypothetical protein D3C81_376540 [compost metagenome]